MSDQVPDIHPALKNAPKTAKQALLRIQRAYGKGLLQKHGKCNYGFNRNGHCSPCAVGFLLTPEQRRWIFAHGMGRKVIKSVQDEVGARNIQAMTGLRLSQLQDIQNAFDYAGPGGKERFTDVLRDMIAKARA